MYTATLLFCLVCLFVSEKWVAEKKDKLPRPRKIICRGEQMAEESSWPKKAVGRSEDLGGFSSVKKLRTSGYPLEHLFGKEVFFG